MVLDVGNSTKMQTYREVYSGIPGTGGKSCERLISQITPVKITVVGTPAQVLSAG
jgi:hypothetical protein